jgi:hypothetical protein
VLHGECFALRPDIKAQHTAGFRSELQVACLIEVYCADGKEYVQVLKWQERARCDKSKYPDPQDSAAERSIPQEKDASLAITSSPLHPRSSPLAAKESQPQSVEDLIAGFSKDETYRGIDVRREYGKMRKWCEINGKKPSKRRLVNWLNKSEQSLPALASRRKAAAAQEPNRDFNSEEVANNFKTWAIEKYEERRDEIALWQTWGDVPPELRTEWWKLRKAEMLSKIGGNNGS